MIQWLLRVLAQTWKSCVPGPRVPPVVIGGAHQRRRWRSQAPRAAIIRHLCNDLFIVTTRPTFLYSRAGLCSAQNGLGTHPPTLDPDDQLQVHLWPSRRFPPPSRALLRDVDGLDDAGGQAGATSSCPSPSAHDPSGRCVSNKRLTCPFLVQPLLNLIIFVIEMALFARLTSRFNAYYDKRPGMHPPIQLPGSQPPEPR